MFEEFIEGLRAGCFKRADEKSWVTLDNAIHPANVRKLLEAYDRLKTERDEADRYKDTWRKAWEVKEEVLKAETNRRVAAEEALADLQRSIASALFGATRDAERVPLARISGHMIDALLSDWMRPEFKDGHEEAMTRAEVFLAEEDRRGR